MSMPVIITIDGVEYPLSYQYQDWREAEHRTRKPLLPGSAKSAKTWDELLPSEEIEMLIFVGLCRSIKDLTPATLYDKLSNEDNFASVMAAAESMAAESIEKMNGKKSPAADPDPTARSLPN